MMTVSNITGDFDDKTGKSYSLPEWKALQAGIDPSEPKHLDVDPSEVTFLS
jgi:hypothetical protein